MSIDPSLYYSPPPPIEKDFTRASTGKMKRVRSMAKYLGLRIVDCSKIFYESPKLKKLLRDTSFRSIHWAVTNNHIDVKHWEEDRTAVQDVVQNYSHIRVPITCDLVPLLESLLHPRCYQRAKEEVVESYLEKQLRELGKEPTKEA